MNQAPIYNWTIYKIVNPNGRVYIGKTSCYEKRVNYYKNGNCKGQKLLFGSFSKYGFDSHEVSVIDEFKSDMTYAVDKEMFWIRSFMSNNCKWSEMKGLNLTDGGDGTIGYKASDEHRKKLSDIHKGRLWSEERKEKRRREMVLKPKKPPKNKKIKVKPTKEETRLKQSLAKRGKPAPNKGKPMPPHQIELLRKINTGRPSWNKGGTMSEESKKKISHAKMGHTYNKGRKQRPEVVAARVAKQIGRPNVALYKPILQYNNNGDFLNEYPSIKHASAETGLSGWTIGCIAKGGMKRSHKFIFKYKAA